MTHHSRRRALLFSLGTALLVAPSLALEQKGSSRRIGVLSPGPPLAPQEYLGVWTPLQRLGWIEGQNVAFERRWADGSSERLRSMARELVGLRVDVIATIGADATLAARNATAVIPIVMLSAGDPVGSGLVASLANPGGNVTGLSMSGPQIEAKRLEILKEALPGLRRVGLLADPGTSIFGYWPGSLEQASRSLDMQLIVAEIHALEELNRALASIVRQGGQAVVIHSDVLFWRRPEQVMASVMKYRLPAAVEGRPLLDAGGLVSYEADEEEQLARFATFVDRILRGSRAADLPVEQPKKFRMMVNLKTAASLGLTVPRSLILRADTVLS